MLKAICWAIKTKLNQIQCDYNDQFQKSNNKDIGWTWEKFKLQGEIMQNLFETEKTLHAISLLPMLPQTRKGETLAKVAKTIREKGKVKEIPVKRKKEMAH